MSTRWHDLFDRARRLESSMASRLDRTATRVAGTGGRRQPLEILHAIAGEMEREVQPAGRGQRTFPFNDVRVWLVAATPQAKARFEALCEGPPSLRDRVVDRLAAAGCSSPVLALNVSYVATPGDDWPQPDYHVELARVAAPPAAVSNRCIEITVTRGVAGRETYSFTAGSIALGRGAEVRDRHRRLIRLNHVAFAESADGVNDTVSRQHAHIDLDRRAGRIYDDGSAQGTSVVRQGRGLAVPRGSRGLSLQDGDEIVLGEACLRVRFHDGTV